MPEKIPRGGLAGVKKAVGPSASWKLEQFYRRNSNRF